MFVEQEYFGSNLKTTILSIRMLPTGSSINRKAADYSQSILATLTAASCIQTIFVMQEENTFVIPTLSVEITPAQKALLDTIEFHGAKYLKKSLQHVKEFVQYQGGTEVAQMDLDHCYMVHLLQKALSKVAKEHQQPTPKTL